MIEVRNNITEDDVARIARFHRDLYAVEYGFDTSFERYVAGPLSEFYRSHSDRDRIWIAEENGQLVGCIAIVGVSQNEAQLRWYLVAPTMRGRGLGTRLLNDAIDFSRAAGYQRVILWTVSGLAQAARRYQSFGFTKVEEKPGRQWGVDLIEEKHVLELKPTSGVDQ